MQIKQENGKQLVVESSWDSGLHKGFNVYLTGVEYNTSNLSEVLSKGQIKALECLLLSTVKIMLEGK
jgi:hypothetical protein